MSEQPLVNIIVPFYNAGPYLAQCLCSLTNQTYHNIAILLVDDGSTDDSLRIANAFVEADKRIKLFTQPNRGQSAARNTALQHVQEGYICFVDADDWLDSDFLERSLNAPQADIIQSGYRRITDNGTIIEQKLPRHSYQFTVPWGRLYRSHLLKNVRFPEGMIYEDVIFSLNLWAKHPKQIIIPYIGYNYRLNPLSTTSRIDKQAQQKLYTTIWDTKAPLWLKLFTILRLKFHFRK